MKSIPIDKLNTSAPFLFSELLQYILKEIVLDKVFIFADRMSTHSVTRYKEEVGTLSFDQLTFCVGSVLIRRIHNCAEYKQYFRRCLRS